VRNWREAGITTGEVLVALLVVVLFALIVIPIYSRANRRTLTDVDVRQIRQVYLAWSTYQVDNNGATSPNLLVLQSRLSSPAMLTSPLDPVTAAGPFPVEPLLPDLEVSSPVRISYGYVGNFLRLGKASVKSWDAYLLDPRNGLMASVWQPDSSSTDQPFRGSVPGPILRINTDGSARTVVPKGEVYGNASVLFGIGK
jgi:type II secretory pathway pseudopilin PulG